VDDHQVHHQKKLQYLQHQNKVHQQKNVVDHQDLLVSKNLPQNLRYQLLMMVRLKNEVDQKKQLHHQPPHHQKQ